MRFVYAQTLLGALRRLAKLPYTKYFVLSICLEYTRCSFGFGAAGGTQRSIYFVPHIDGGNVSSKS